MKLSIPKENVFPKETLYGQKAIDRYNTDCPKVALMRFIGKGLYEECSLADAKSALKLARNINSFILSDPEKAVMLLDEGDI